MDLQKEYRKYTKWTNRRIRLNRFYRTEPKEFQAPNRYYSDKVSFLREFLKTLCRLIALWLICIVIAMISKSFQSIFAYAVILGTLAIAFYFMYYVIRCAREKNLRL